jgi:hypothetical protein
MNAQEIWDHQHQGVIKTSATPSELAELIFDLAPTSYQFLSGHCVAHQITPRPRTSGLQHRSTWRHTQTRPAIRSDTSRYVRMRDGGRITVTSTMPSSVHEGQRVPAVLRIARYWRRFGHSVAGEFARSRSKRSVVGRSRPRIRAGEHGCAAAPHSARGRTPTPILR